MAGDRSGVSQQPPAKIDITVPHSARIWNYWLGGKDNYEIDRTVGDQVAQLYPGIRQTARLSRALQVRVITYLAAEAGIRQFLDVGTGLPTANNTHQVAQRIAPESRVVYVDNDPVVLAHARALLTSRPEGATAYIDADLHDTGRIMSEAAGTLDFTQPIALMLNGIIGHIEDDDEARACVRRLVDALPPGSYLAMSDGTDTEQTAVRSSELYKDSGAIPYHMRSPDVFVSFFDGLELVEPGIVPRQDWRPDASLRSVTVRLPSLAGVARKPS
ncbi:MAG: SAM-dependent methyltransferase [Actinobacteria bacterium]|nr:SAM-dependent methyltransferase [Actinomycetota bacterium]MBO0784678.1 SAM-dependent methyltransferase [Actinomycetota bacterium]MBO0813574.1 SAM-dependent methyltransferase [Actinomycetota bacterium]